jgi:hypothetical protein
MRPFRWLMITWISSTLLMSLTTGCAEKRQSTRYLTESWPPPAPQAQASAQQTDETTASSQDAAQRTEDPAAREKP